MAKAIVDPNELRRFAQDMKRFNEDLQQNMKKLHGRLTQLSQSWRDQEHRKFVAEYEETMKVLVRFNQAAEKHIPFLLRKADRVDEYLQQR